MEILNFCPKCGNKIDYDFKMRHINYATKEEAWQDTNYCCMCGFEFKKLRKTNEELIDSISREIDAILEAFK